MSGVLACLVEESMLYGIMAGCCHELCSCDLGTCLSLASDFLKAWPEMQGLAQQKTPDVLAVEKIFVARKREATSSFHEYFLASSAP
jgi:hypothetical protein